MPQDISFTSIPLNSLASWGSEERLPYLEKAFSLPQPLQNIVCSPRTGAYLRGVSKEHGLPEDRVSALALLVLRVALGEVTLNQSSENAIKELGLDQEHSRALALALEKNLFTPYLLELKAVQERAARPADTTPPIAPAATPPVDPPAAPN